VSIQTVDFNGEKWLSIQNVNTMRPFFMSIVSDSNHWMFISSNGGLSAGRKNAELALFPYYTDDKITELAPTTGSKTIFQVAQGNSVVLWEPFTGQLLGETPIRRNLYKNKFGNKILFEEIHDGLGLSFQYEWASSNQYGFVKTATLKNLTSGQQTVRVLDGIQNIMPYGVSSDLQGRASNLVDAYKRNELVAETGLGIYALSAIIVDKAEPSEALKANIAWSFGLNNAEYLVSSAQLDAFRENKAIQQELDVKGDKGAYFIHTTIKLDAKGHSEWSIVTNVNQTHNDVIALNNEIKNSNNLAELVKANVEEGTKQLIQLVASADGLQQTADELKDSRHYANVLFNIMRGGIFDNNYQIEKPDFVTYLTHANLQVAERNEAFLAGLPEVFDRNALSKKLADSTDLDLIRLSTEYLPLKFSRRHGDPSRPWNKFSINTNSDIDGSKILDYEGNWRDIFQNWEALAHSYPSFLEGMIFKFLNASTFDGYNPYRVTKGGFDWETIEPDDPWSYIGYWGDHQIIYLLKFLEFYQKLQPEAFEELFSKSLFVYANVPYRIKSYKDIAINPKDTIEFDEKADHSIREQVAAVGADGAVLKSGQNSIHHVNFMEKILATVLAKVSNFIPEGGIWMNTQRPEWNDANNALVGNGVSMVTLYYLRRFLKFFEPIIQKNASQGIQISEELAKLFKELHTVLATNVGMLDAKISDADRKKITEGLGQAGSQFRDSIYQNGFSGEKSTLSLSEVSDFVKTTLSYLEQSIDANERPDHLYHAYNLMSFKEGGISIDYLDEMLEGQVAVLSSGYLDASSSLKVLDALRASSLYRADQESYILYPNKNLAGFLNRNNIPSNAVKKSSLLQKLVADGNRQIVSKDVEGGYHFNGNFKNAGDLKSALQELSNTNYAALAEAEEALLLDIFEEVFNHKSFTGRSGTFFGYEGLGSIYWHMVSKLHLACWEVCNEAISKQSDQVILDRLAEHFDEIGKGIGVHKSPEVYGAFPTDPYSHTPQFKGAQQPGMTGQVKEDILTRFGELGLAVYDGKLHFKPGLLKKIEFISEVDSFKAITVTNDVSAIEIPKKGLAFTFCQVPIIYQIADKDAVSVIYQSGESKNFETLSIDEKITHDLFERTGLIKQIKVFIRDNHLR
jgi:hypothetical protein